MNATIVQGDLLDQDVDVIVNAWNRNLIPWWLLLSQGVSGVFEPSQRCAEADRDAAWPHASRGQTPPPKTTPNLPRGLRDSRAKRFAPRSATPSAEVRLPRSEKP
jgi:hypothetical protein